MKKSQLKKIIRKEIINEVELLSENRGQDAATELIAKLRNSLYKRLSTLEFEAFKFEMIDHLGGTGGYIN